ncbi:conserved hypothetical protein YidD [Mobiluncus curtisii ATCC 51333]|uniref:Putative membrane protein insertion efficiency factor n=1 Tax=Mobiluncus curtisii ATCC 51333 TaxID=887326 RepID=E6LWF9_9ACTO|nr:conserved hypothetical protein YidD [Mobiluncus curtisii ATCC 51333]
MLAGKALWRWVWNLPATVSRLFIHIYQHTLSKAFGPVCKYYPSCSHYADLALQVHGFWKGSALTLWRLLRCNPYSDGGVDYPPVKGSWTNPWTAPGSISSQTYGLSPGQNALWIAEASGDTLETKERTVSCC